MNSFHSASFQMRSVFILTQLILITSAKAKDFVFNGFQGANLKLNGGANIHSNGLLQLTNFSFQQKGHAFFPSPLRFDKPLSFSSTFAFAMDPQVSSISGHGIVFVITPSIDFSQALAGQYFGILNSSTNGLNTTRIFAVELDTIRNLEFDDIDSNHVGIDVNNLTSVASASVTYNNQSLNLISGKPMQIWIVYDDEETRIDIAIAPLKQPKPSKALLTAWLNLSSVVLHESMYVGFSSSTGSVASNHYVLGWSFNQGKEAQSLDYSKFPKLPKVGGSKKLSHGSIALVVILSSFLVLIFMAVYVTWKKLYQELIEDWEKEYILHRLLYKDLYKATKGFKTTEIIGKGGFGKVYKGILPSRNIEIAVKRVAHESGKGMKEFVAEIASMSRVRHRNLVQLLGYSRREKELLLVYDYMPNGSLDKHLFDTEKPALRWNQRLVIIKGVASAILYLHEGWEQLVIHRDIKASNVLLDSDMNSCLGDFGLARLYDHGSSNTRTTRVVGTVGYLAPELARKGRATTETDVYAFGTFLLEVVCGRRPIERHGNDDPEVLVDWVYGCWKRGEMVNVVDPRLEGDYVKEEAEMVLKLGLICTHSRPQVRPRMRKVVQFLNGDDCLSEVYLSSAGTYLLSSSRNPDVPLFPVQMLSSSTRFSDLALYDSTESVLHIGR
ncbi:hypothetical protein V2J09_007049 [Rumex salicifolius]